MWVYNGCCFAWNDVSNRYKPYNSVATPVDIWIIRHVSCATCFRALAFHWPDDMFGEYTIIGIQYKFGLEPRVTQFAGVI